jgi:hypothetical protein
MQATNTTSTNAAKLMDLKHSLYVWTTAGLLLEKRLSLDGLGPTNRAIRIKELTKLGFQSDLRSLEAGFAQVEIIKQQIAKAEASSKP